MATAPGASVNSWRMRATSHLPAILSAIPVLMIPALEWIPAIPERTRPWIILGSLVVAAIGLGWTTRREKSVTELAQELARLKRGIERAEPEHLLREVAATVFREGAWRLTIYRKSHSSEPDLGDHLVRLACVASDGDQSSLGPALIGIRPSTHFAHLFLSNLADARYRHAEESGAFPDDVYSAPWEDWRRGIFGNPIQSAPDRSTFRARKYVWYAAQEPRTQAVFAVIAESATEEGIVIEYLDHVLTPAWLFFVSRLTEIRDGAA